ncbi:outer membrane protein [Aestuariivirga sp.]|uniref:outer membrane protein n=1 Tax=Aestuariivirga sp. TaxID=2650926 RepID=UPI003919E866
MFKKSSIAALISIGLLGGTAHAADIVPAPGYDWTGFYIGANVGYGWGDTEYTYEGLMGPSSSVDFDYDGIVGGGAIGYNWQHDSIVFGIEADISASGISGDETRPPEEAPCYEEGCSADINWFGTGRVRVGYALDNVMPFITGGVAAVGLEGDADEGACGFVGSCGFDDTKWGWTVGGGLELGLTESWSAKAEYLYVGVDAPDFNEDSTSADDLDFSVIRVGVNYRFY